MTVRARGHLAGSARWHWAGGLTLALALWLLPVRWVEGLRGAALDLLRPGQHVAEQGLEWGRASSLAFHDRAALAERASELEAELARLTAENDDLRGQFEAARLAAASAHGEHSAPEASEEPLLASRLIPARLLGRQAQAFLGAHDLLDAGSAAGVQPQAWVVDAPPPVVDQGATGDVAAGDYVLSGRRVLGRVASVGRHTSALVRVSDAGYRDLVIIAHRAGDALEPGPQGLLEGTGSECRIRLVDVETPVTVGDQVYTADTEGLLPAPLWYGEIVSVEAPPGARHWEIRVEPAARARAPRVAIVRTELNPRRLVGKEGSGIRN